MGEIVLSRPLLSLCWLHCPNSTCCPVDDWFQSPKSRFKFWRSGNEQQLEVSPSALASNSTPPTADRQDLIRHALSLCCASLWLVLAPTVLTSKLQSSNTNVSLSSLCILNLEGNLGELPASERTFSSPMEVHIGPSQASLHKLGSFAPPGQSGENIDNKCFVIIPDWANC